MYQLILFAQKGPIISNKFRPTVGRYQIHSYWIVVPLESATTFVFSKLFELRSIAIPISF